MSRTRKIQAARLMYKDSKEIPAHLKNEVSKLKHNFVIVRYGKNRHLEAKLKVIYRRKKKAKQQQITREHIKQELKEYNE